LWYILTFWSFFWVLICIYYVLYNLNFNFLHGYYLYILIHNLFPPAHGNLCWWWGQIDSSWSCSGAFLCTLFIPCFWWYLSVY
jgi:hypothetical protein